MIRRVPAQVLVPVDAGWRLIDGGKGIRRVDGSCRLVTADSAFGHLISGVGAGPGSPLTAKSWTGRELPVKVLRALELAQRESRQG